MDLDEELRLAINQVIPFTSTFERRFREFFGINVVTMNFLFQFLKIVAPEYKIRASHLLMAMYFLKQYPTVSVAAKFWGVDEKTFRLHTWTVLFVLFEQLQTVS